MLENSSKPSDVSKLEKQIKQAREVKPQEPPHHSGKGTRARLNTAAEKFMFSSKYST